MMTLESALLPPRHPWEIDHRHVSWMLDVMCSQQYDKGLEIGSFFGYSALAFAEAYKRGHFKEVHLCDIKIRPQLAEVLQQHPFLQFHQIRSTRLLRQWGNRYDFVFVDGDHTLPTVMKETSRLLRMKPLALFAHDTNNNAVGIKGQEGPSYLKYAFQSHPDFYTLEDALLRDGEHTHRGMFFATPSLEVFKAAKIALAKWGPP